METAATPLHKAMTDALFGYSQEKVAQISAADRFVHYTSADTAMRILKGESDGKRYLWLRNATDMNDFSEIEWGRYCFQQSVVSDNELGTRLTQLINQIEPNMAVNLASAMAADFNSMKANAHLVSLSLHGGSLVNTGLLSMWRAYGGPDNVCFVFKTAAFMGHQLAYELVLSPVLYANPGDYKSQFISMLGRIEDRLDILKTSDPAYFLFNLKRAIDFSILSTKHPGFSEEREWRIIHYPNPFKDRGDPPSDVVSINGKVQKIYKVPMENQAAKDLVAATPNELIERVIVGPTQNYELVRVAFVKLLGDAGVQNPESRVEFSGIPLRR